MEKTLNYGDMCAIAQFIQERHYTPLNLTIEIPVSDSDLMMKVCEEFHYRSGKTGDVEFADTVNVNMGGVKFRYVLEDS